MKNIIFMLLLTVLVFSGCEKPGESEERRPSTDASIVIDSMEETSTMVRWSGIHITKDSSPQGQYWFGVDSSRTSIIDGVRTVGSRGGVRQDFTKSAITKDKTLLTLIILSQEIVQWYLMLNR